MYKKSIIFFSLFLLFSCASTPPSPKRTRITPVVVEKVFMASYDYTWSVALTEMGRYELKIVNKDAGIILTEDIIGFEDTKTARKRWEPRRELKYHIDIRITALTPSGDIPRTQVSITKFIVKLSSFGVERPIGSNLIDENVILYRIKRLLEIERLKIERNRIKGS